MLPWTPLFYQIGTEYSTHRMWYVCHVEKKCQLRFQCKTHAQLMLHSTPNMTMGACDRIRATRATKSKTKTVAALKRKSCRHPLQSRCHSRSTPGNALPMMHVFMLSLSACARHCTARCSLCQGDVHVFDNCGGRRCGA